MTTNAKMHIIQVVFEKTQEGRFYAHSDDLPGLHLFGNDRAEVERSIEPAIVALFKHGYDTEVTVYPNSDLRMCGMDRQRVQDQARFVAAVAA